MKNIKIKCLLVFFLSLYFLDFSKDEKKRVVLCCVVYLYMFLLMQVVYVIFYMRKNLTEGLCRFFIFIFFNKSLIIITWKRDKRIGYSRAVIRNIMVKLEADFSSFQILQYYFYRVNLVGKNNTYGTYLYTIYARLTGCYRFNHVLNGTNIYF